MNKTLETLETQADEDPMVKPMEEVVEPLLMVWAKPGDPGGAERETFQGNTTGLEVLGGAVGLWDQGGEEGSADRGDAGE